MLVSFLFEYIDRYLSTPIRHLRMSMKNQKGFYLVEVLVSVALIAIITVGFLTALSAAPKTIIRTDEHETAKNIAEMQMEHIRNLAYADAYSPMTMPAEYEGYSLVTTGGVVQAQNITSHSPGQIQKITIIVQRNNKDVYTLSSYKAQ